MPCSVTECGRRGATGGVRAGVSMAACVTRVLVFLIAPYIGVKARNARWLKLVIASEAIHGATSGDVDCFVAPLLATTNLTIPQPGRGSTAAERGNPVHRHHHNKRDDQHGDAEHGDRGEVAAFVEVVDQ